MSEIKTVDDLIAALKAREDLYSRRVHDHGVSLSLNSAYYYARELAKELKANMEKNNG